jgi:hypothetical protein
MPSNFFEDPHLRNPHHQHPHLPTHELGSFVASVEHEKKLVLQQFQAFIRRTTPQDKGHK